MLGLLGTLNLASRSLQVQRQGVEVAGHNLANVNNPAYTRQRLTLAAAALSAPGQLNQGSGVQAVAVVQLRSRFIEDQILTEAGVRGSLEARESTLEQAQTTLGKLVPGSGDDGSPNLDSDLTSLFSAFQAVANDPSSLPERQNLLAKASALAARFNSANSRLDNLQQTLDTSVQADTAKANGLIGEIARLNAQIAQSESGAGGSANDLRDLRQSRIEELAKILPVTSTESNGELVISTSGTTLLNGSSATAPLEAYTAPNGHLLVRLQGAAAALTFTSGSLQGAIETRDADLSSLRNGLNTMAATLITEVNKIHAPGASLTGSTGANFFSGSGAGDIAVNPALLGDPRLIQLAQAGGSIGNNQVALALSGLQDATFGALGGSTLSGRFQQQAGALAQSLAAAKGQLEDQDQVEALLQNQRNSISGVSLDEEMADLMKYQKAFEASARLMSTVDEMLETVINLKR